MVTVLAVGLLVDALGEPAGIGVGIQAAASSVLLIVSAAPVRVLLRGSNFRIRFMFDVCDVKSGPLAEAGRAA